MIYKAFWYIDIPALRFIGVDAWPQREEWLELWDRKNDFLPQLQAMDGLDPTIPYVCAFLHHDDGEINDHGEPDRVNRYLVGRFFKAGTPVPDGYSYHDLVPQTIGMAIYEKMTDIDEGFWQRYIITRDKILKDGVAIPYPVGYWHAEAYISGVPPIKPFDCAVMFACKR